MEISKLVKDAHEDAVNKGFYDCPECGGVNAFCLKCEGSGFDNDRNIGELLMLVVSELGEAVEAHRKGRFSQTSKYEYDCSKETLPDYDGETFKCWIKDTFEDKLADAVIRIADMCRYLGIDLEKHIKLKIKYNATREYKHGKK
jgi:NTP pyrophosphatase (non-canonical NTP hydrolase)